MYIMTAINVKRVYADAGGIEPEDGYRVFVDRLWPRGESKEKFHYDLWAKDMAPSTELREWYHADPAGRWNEFRQRYFKELDLNPETPQFVEELSRKPVVTLLYGSRDEVHNNAVILADYLRSRLQKQE